MATPEMFWFLTFTLICSGSCSVGISGQVLYHDLTQPIQQVLVKQNTTYKQIIRNALKSSPFVYYETDILLSKIEQILPVIDLLQQLKENENEPKLMLSIPYVNKTDGTLILDHLDDIFYNCRFDIRDDNRPKIVNGVAAIVLDLSYPSPYKDSFGPYKFSFTNYVKRFTKLMFGEGVIQVGVKLDYFSDKYRGGNNHMQISTADFVVHEIRIDFKKSSLAFENFASPTNTKVREVAQFFTQNSRTRKDIVLPILKFNNNNSWSLISTQLRGFYAD